MKYSTNPGAAYLRFLRLSKEVRKSPTLPILDPVEECLLQLISCEMTGPLSVSDVIVRKEIGSPAMLHKRLTSMREKGWIMLSDTEDARRKQILLTQAALMHFEKLSRCMGDALYPEVHDRGREMLQQATT